MPTAKKSPPRRRPTLETGSLRVQGWLHSALWPLWEAAHHELRLLATGDLTWRFGHGRLDGLREARAHLGAAGRTNLEDLLEVGHTELGAVLDRQAKALQALTAAAAVAQVSLANGPVRDAVMRQPHGARQADDVTLATLAQDLINGAVDREVLGPESGIWHDIRGGLAVLRATGLLAGLEAARAELTAATAELERAIVALREVLCDRYDLPPAPVGPAAPGPR